MDVDHLSFIKVSIITVCINSENTIQKAIESVIAQTYKNIEYIVIDGNSKDNTINIINRYRNNISYLISEPDKGLYDAMNKGILASTGVIIGILNSDDIFSSNSVIADVVDCFLRNPSSLVVFGDVVFVSQNSPDLITRHYCARSFRPWKLRFGWMPPHTATFLNRSVFKKVGLYSLNYKISSDYEMFIRIFLIASLPYTYLNKVLVVMRSGGISSSGINSKILLNREIVIACRNNGFYTNLFLVLLKVPLKLLEFIR